jgi:hypothetical protein
MLLAAAIATFVVNGAPDRSGQSRTRPRTAEKMRVGAVRIPDNQGGFLR